MQEERLWQGNVLGVPGVSHHTRNTVLNKPYFDKDTIKLWQSGQIITLRVAVQFHFLRMDVPTAFHAKREWQLPRIRERKKKMCPFFCLSLSRGYVCAFTGGTNAPQEGLAGSWSDHFWPLWAAITGGGQLCPAAVTRLLQGICQR